MLATKHFFDFSLIFSASLVCTTLLFYQVVSAQPTPVITDADIEQAKKVQPDVTNEDIENAKKRYRTPTENELNRASIPSTPKTDALPTPNTSHSIDLEAIAEGYKASHDRNIAQGLTNSAKLLVFVSFTMPEATLIRLIDQAARSNATIIIRGPIDGSLTKTVSTVHQLIGQRRVEVQIDPQAFERFSVIKAPTFVLLKNGAQAQPCMVGMCFTKDSFALTAGDVSLDYALEHILSLSPGMAKDARTYLTKLRGK